MTAAAYTRGQLLASRKTGAIAFASLAQILAFCATGLIALSFSDINGAVVGVVALIGAFTSEMIILGCKVRYAEYWQGGLFHWDRKSLQLY